MKKDSVRKKFIEELEKTPIVSVVCEKVGISRNTFYRWIKEDAHFALAVGNAMDMGVALVGDFAESNVLNGIRNKDTRLTQFWLTHRHPSYKRQFVSDRDHADNRHREYVTRMLEADIETQKWMDAWIKTKRKMDERNRKRNSAT
ncbi:hypothetical protein KBD09_04040 [Candidatus Woesebacteria bacterium]|jgi:predicted DNA-binding transcriptional regulator AlpA|nr:hypothetical protein [Candidatus Woesebacteria bacterium]MDQ5950499.1 hypothetical protein [Patescibacteria group bacterium]